MEPIKTRYLLLPLALYSLTACGGKTDADSTASAAVATPRPSTPAPSRPPAPTRTAEPTLTALAFKMGDKYGFALNFSILQKPDLVDKDLAIVRELAGKLGVAAPELPGKGQSVAAIVRAVEGELRRKSPALADGFVLGQEIAEQFMGASLDRVSRGTLTNIGVRMKGAGLRGEAARTRYEALGAKPSSDQIGALEEACAAELKISMD